MTDLTHLTATEAAALIAGGEITSEELTTALLARITERDPVVHAWTHLDPEFSLAQARAADRAPRRSALHGVPFGIKDVIDTAGFPTEYGSRIYAGNRPTADARCVTTMREAGCVPLGKLDSTEFALYTPNRARNPVDPRHTAGGSSSGTGAAVGDRQVPIAFGNQTAGSLIRPSAYCGDFGLKPTHGIADQTGILPLEPLFDTLGHCARSVADLQAFAHVVSGIAVESWQAGRTPRIGLCRTPQWAEAQPEARAVLFEAARRLEQDGVDVEELALPEDYATLPDLHRDTLNQGLARSFRREYAEHADELSPRLRAMLESGARHDDETYAAHRAAVTARRAEVDAVFGRFDALLTPSAPGEAPAGTETGSPIFQVTWSLLGVPCITLPVGAGPNGLPVGVQLVGRRHDDARLLALAADLAPRIGTFGYAEARDRVRS